MSGYPSDSFDSNTERAHCRVHCPLVLNNRGADESSSAAGEGPNPSYLHLSGNSGSVCQVQHCRCSPYCSLSAPGLFSQDEQRVGADLVQQEYLNGDIPVTQPVEPNRQTNGVEPQPHHEWDGGSETLAGGSSLADVQTLLDEHQDPQASAKSHDNSSTEVDPSDSPRSGASPRSDLLKTPSPASSEVMFGIGGWASDSDSPPSPQSSPLAIEDGVGSA